MMIATASVPDFALDRRRPVASLLPACARTFRDAALLVERLGYGRNSNPLDWRLVPAEARGTCTTKHALLVALAREHGVPSRLVLCFFEMSPATHRAVAEPLARFGLSSILEAHCLLGIAGELVDVTGLPFRAEAARLFWVCGPRAGPVARQAGVPSCCAGAMGGRSDHPTSAGPARRGAGGLHRRPRRCGGEGGTSVTVYAIAQLTITDRPVYDRYRDGFMATLSPFGGRLLAADERPRVVEGAWAGDKVVVIAFEEEARFDAWMTSPDYVRIAADRKAGAHGPVLLVRGI